MQAEKLNTDLLELYIRAGSTEMSSQQLRVLAGHRCEKIRIRVAENPSTPLDLLWHLAHDESPDVRIAVGCNPSCDECIINLLRSDDDITVRHGLAQSIETPRMLLETLAEDDNGWVREEALKSLRILGTNCYSQSGGWSALKRSPERETMFNFERHAESQTKAAG
ncbi:MAG: HEAT repeat domain-containing protein [Candidatus Obscuribacterales bacterium]|nr:HEAT repeat domain-containing protein [Candidatus Obscuribacterales bacterium]